MVALFADLPEAIENTVEIAKRCAFQGVFAVTRSCLNSRMTKSKSCVANPKRACMARLAVIPHAVHCVREYEERLEFELEIIEGHGVSGLLPDRCGLYQVGQGSRAFPLDRGVGLVRGLLWRMR